MKHLLLLLCLAGWAGCDDPASRRRIQIRTDNFAETAASLGEREARGPEKMEAAGRTLEKWWKSDSARFEARLRTIGDYAW